MVNVAKYTNLHGWYGIRNFQKNETQWDVSNFRCCKLFLSLLGFFHSLLLIDHLLTKFFGAASLNKEQADDFAAGNFPLKNGDSRLQNVSLKALPGNSWVDLFGHISVDFFGGTLGIHSISWLARVHPMWFVKVFG